MKLKPINQQVAVIFGASSGIGRDTALQFARRGAKVVVAARGEAGLDSLIEEIRREGGEARAVVADARHIGQVQAVADQAAEWYGRLDTWVHLAAVAVYAPFEQTTPQEFKHVIEVNLIEGDFSDEAKSASLYTWLELHPATATLIGSIALGALAALTRRALSNGANGAGRPHSLSEQGAAIPEELAVLG
jgi:NAD(P)-dependent dehydrogenase (short-subunit alcohol dehydrogenase family)